MSLTIEDRTVMTDRWKEYSWNIEFTLEDIPPVRRHIYVYTLLVLFALAANTLVVL